MNASKWMSRGLMSKKWAVTGLVFGIASVLNSFVIVVVAVIVTVTVIVVTATVVVVVIVIVVVVVVVVAAAAVAAAAIACGGNRMWRNSGSNDVPVGWQQEAGQGRRT
ncbi:unnamed protein product [Litomosoides sigmodontis]|uniref:Uncharacterized protein n=1 Tax=Litomosoides sigmodontis TaxID=42156 RepID=A0A3P6SQC4_LITSI|nr:unnamed protein product [Litomosoides sigmodontis]